MINVAHARAALASMQGDTVAMPRTQVAEMLTEVEVGQHARRSLNSLRSMVAIAASTSGAPA